MKNIQVWMVAALLTSVAAAWAGDSRARTYVLGERAGGMGGAAVAIAQGLDACYYNPAGLAHASADSLSLSANLYGFQDVRVESGLFPGDDVRSTEFVTIPTAMGGVKRMGEDWACAFSILTPDQRKCNVITAKSGTLHLYQYSVNDQTIWAGPSVGWTTRGRWSFGLSLFGAYRSCSQNTSIFNEESEYSYVESAKFDDLGLLALFGAQVAFGDGWFAGLTLQTPSLHVFDTGRVSANLTLASDGESGSVYTEDVETRNLSPFQASIGIGREVPGEYAFALDVLYRDARDFTVQRWSAASDEGFTRISNESVVDISLGGEIILAERYPLRGGVFTSFSAAKDIMDEDEGATSDVDLYGITLSIGRQSDTMAVNIGLSYAWGFGHDRGYADSDSGIPKPVATSANEQYLFATMSTSYFF